MKKQRLLFLLFSVFFSALVFAASPSKDTELEEKISSYVQEMSLQEKLGQMCLMNFRFWEKDSSVDYKNLSPEAYLENLQGLTEINDTILLAIKKYKLGNTIFFAENLRDKEKALKLIKALNEASKDASGINMLFAMDQEGGNVNRIYSEAVMPSAMSIGKTENPVNAGLAGRLTGMLMKSYGITCNLAPVCDISSNQKNPVIGIRSYSDNPETAGLFALNMYKGLEQSGIISCAKHFPGHGDTDTDSHLAVPVIKKSFDEWNETERVPFQRLIDSGVPMIMTAHIQIPQLDATKITGTKTGKKILRPATLSHKILTDLLRNKMGFSGVVVTDAMDMLAIKNNFQPEDAFIESVNAGADMVCHPVNIYSEKDLEQADIFFSKLISAVKNGRLPEKRIDEAVERILYMKAKYGLMPELNDNFHLNKESIFIDSKLFENEVQRMETETIKKTFTPSLSGTEDFSDLSSKKLLVLVPKNYMMETVRNLLKEKNILSSNVEILSFEKKKFIDRNMKEEIAGADRIILFTYLDGYAVKKPSLPKAKLPKKISSLISKQKKQAETFAVSLCLPYDQNNFSGLNYFATCNYREEAIQAALNFIFSRKEIN